MAQPHLTGLIIVSVLGAGALHASWNAMVKPLADKTMAFALIGTAMGIAGAVTLVFTGLPGAAGVPFAFGSAVIHVGYEIGLMNSYRLGAFNQVYPIARGTSPLLVAVVAYAVVGERLAGPALAGVVILAAGLMSLALSAGLPGRADAPAIGVAVLTGLTIAAYTVVDGLGVRAGHDALAYGGLMFALQGPVFPVVIALRRVGARRHGARRHGPAQGGAGAGGSAGTGGDAARPAWPSGSVAARGLAAGFLSVIAYGIVLWAQGRAPLAEVAAIRETSVIFAAGIGMLVLRERFGPRRIAAAVVIAAGIVLISV